MAEQSIWGRMGDAIFGGGDVAQPDTESTITKAASPTQTLGTSSSSVNDYAGVITVPDRRLNLIGQQRYDTFDEMVRDVAIVAAGVRLFLNLLSNAEWTVNPPDGLNDNEKPVAEEYALRAYNDLFNMTSSWSQVVRRAAEFRLQGFAVLEWTAKRNTDGTIGFLDVEKRPQRTIARWLRDASGTVEAIVQRVPGRGDVTLPRAKVVYLVDDTLTDSPEGVGLYRHLAATADRLRQFLELEEVGFSTDLRGIPIARAPLGELKAEAEAAGAPGTDARAKAESRRSAMLRPLTDFIMKHVRNKHSGMVLPSDTYTGTTVDKASTPSSVSKWALELLNGDSSSFADMANAVQRMNQELARILGVEHLLLGSDGSGSLALARSKVGTFYLTVTSTLLDLVEVFDRDLLRPWAELNGVPPELCPQMGVNEISDRDIEQVLDALAKLAQAGAPMLPTDPAVGEIYDLLGLTRPPEDTLSAMADATLNPTRNDPVDPDAQMNNNPEDGRIKKRRTMLRSRRKRRR